jgi:hypothetical protein
MMKKFIVLGMIGIGSLGYSDVIINEITSRVIGGIDYDQ